MKRTKICHCAHCYVEDFCAANNWQLYEPNDPCCPNMKEGRKQYKQFLKEYFEEKDYIEKYLYE